MGEDSGGQSSWLSPSNWLAILPFTKSRRRSHEASYEPLSSINLNLPARHSDAGRKLGTFRAVLLVALCCTGSFVFAYDTGIVGGVLTLPAFQRDFGYTEEEKTSVNAYAVSVLQAGAFFGCFLIWPISNYLGRRWSLMLCSLVFCLGAVFQVINSHSLACFYAGRVISGLATGGATVLVPMFSAEMAPKEIRGQLGSCFQLFFATGVAISYWVDWLVEVSIDSNLSKQWQLAIGLQFIPGAAIGIGMLFVKESARWLAKKGRHQEAFTSLRWVRGDEDSEELRQEFAEIQSGIEQELHASEGLTWKELLLPSNRYRLFIAFTIQLCGQFTGNTSLAYYAPQIFSSIGAGSETLFLTGFFGMMKIAGVTVFIIFFVDTYGRRIPFIAGAFTQGCLLLAIAIIVAKNPPSPDNTHMTPAGIAAILIVYLEAFAFNMSWGPLPWLYISEIFPTRIREPGIAVGASSQWLWNFTMSQLTPHALATIGSWRTFALFSIFNFLIVVYSVVFTRETMGLSLEEMDVLFGVAVEDGGKGRGGEEGEGLVRGGGEEEGDEGGGGGGGGRTAGD